MAENELAETDDDALIPGPAPLTPKEERFCRAYADPESETYGKASKSAEAAKYQEPHNAAWKLRRRPRIIARIAEYEKLTRVQIGKVLTDLEHERQLALAKGDLATAVRASELQGKHLAMFVDRMAVDETELPRYDARLALEQSRITAILLMNPQAPPALPEATAAGQEPQAPQQRQESES